MIGDEVTSAAPAPVPSCHAACRMHGRVPARKPRGCCFSTLRPRWAGLLEERHRTGRNFVSMNEREVTEICQRYGWEIVGPPPL